MRKPTLALMLADLRDDLSRFHLVHYGGRVDGFLVSGHNSGTHWLRFMLSAAIANHLGLPPPEHSSGPASDAFIGHARHPRRFAQAPRIGSSHHLPSRLVAALGRLGLLRIPPVVVLVRNIPDALTSYFLKWREAKALGGLSDYVARAPSAQGVDVWWFIRFFNRWGLLRRAFPDRVLVVRYEDLQAEPAVWVRRIWAHWGLALDEADVAAALAVCARETVASRLDPAYGENITPDRRLRAAVRLDSGEAAVVGRRLVSHLRCDFGYAARLRSRREALRGAS
jgi:hypothetical protein